jgi:hypothetical protein
VVGAFEAEAQGQRMRLGRRRHLHVELAQGGDGRVGEGQAEESCSQRVGTTPASAAPSSAPDTVASVRKRPTRKLLRLVLR